MDNKLITETAMKIIVHAGNARSLFHEIVKNNKQMDQEFIINKIKEAEDELLKAHNIQTKLLQTEANGDKIVMTLLLSHAQDTLTEATMEEYVTKLFFNNREKIQ